MCGCTGNRTWLRSKSFFLLTLARVHWLNKYLKTSIRMLGIPGREKDFKTLHENKRTH